MNKLKKGILLLIIFMVAILPVSSGSFAEAADSVVPSASDNLHIGLRKKSALTPLPDGYMKVLAHENTVWIEYYDDDFNVKSKKSIALELPIWGGFYAGQDAYYLIEGQNNLEELDTAEVIRVIKYDTGWNRIGAAAITCNPELFGGEVKYPFDAGCVEAAEVNGTLYIVTGHEGYAEYNGEQGHQGFLMIAVDEGTMTGKIVTADFSHSFAQYIVSRGSDLYVLEQSEGSRSTILSRYNTQTEDWETLTLLKYGGVRDSAWAIACYASVDGMAMSAENLLCVGTSIDQSLYDSVTSDMAHNIYLTVTPVSNFSEEATQIKWLTQYSGNGKSFLGLKITRITDNRFMISWEEYEESGEAAGDDTLSTSILHYLFVDGSGEKVSKEYTQPMAISDCQPVVKGEKAVYFAANGNMVDFYSVDTGSGAAGKKTYRVAGDNVVWNIANGVLTLTGTGPISINQGDGARLPLSSTSHAFVYSSDQNPWRTVRDSVKKIVVESGITSISDEAFCYFDNLEEVELKDGLLSIGKKAFYSCESLSRIMIPASVTNIGEDFLWTGYLWLDYSHKVDAVICAPFDSYAIQYAKANEISYLIDLSKAAVSGLKESYEYTGKEVKPSVTVTLGNTVLNPKEDYSLSYKNNKKKGTATLVITGKGNYTGSITKTFNIVQKQPSETEGDNTSSGWASSRKMPAKGTPSEKGTVFREIKTGIQYKVTKKAKSGSATVEYKKAQKNVSKVTIPSTVKINGVTYKVTSVADKLLYGNKKVKTVALGKNIVSIGKQAFYKCANLKSITISSTGLKESKIGAKAFKGISQKAVIKVPAKMLKTYKSILKSKGIGSKVKVVAN